ncbi:hypothetical protein [Selenomonas sp. ND2010]|uniref:hypothetical protein n=1 Tax=Selenomonas sp. ND2010 TaxID=1410618 RepID=UPI0035109920
MGGVYVELNEYDKAIECCEKSLKFSQKEAAPFFVLASAYNGKKTLIRQWNIMKRHLN